MGSRRNNLNQIINLESAVSRLICSQTEALRKGKSDYDKDNDDDVGS